MAEPMQDPSLHTLDAARAEIRRLVRAIPQSETVALADADRRILAADLVAPVDVPGHDNSAMDGYALRYADLNADAATRLPVRALVLAGAAPSAVPGPGACVRIMTGAPLPADTDTVVPIEAALETGAGATCQVSIPRGQQRGQHVRRAGEDIRAGSVLLRAGQRLGPAELGLAASIGLAYLRVFRRLRVACFSTGDELAAPGGMRNPGQAFDANRPMLCAWLARLGFEVLDLGVVADDAARLEAALASASHRADAIVTSGGVSGGDADHVRAIAGRLGAVSFWKLALRPGRPFAFGRIGDAWLFALPGNPVAAMVAFGALARDGLLRLAGETDPPEPPLLQARCESALRKRPGRVEYQRGILVREPDGLWRVRSTGDQGAGILNSMSRANCYIVLDATRGDVAAGESVPVQLFEGLY